MHIWWYYDQQKLFKQKAAKVAVPMEVTEVHIEIRKLTPDLIVDYMNFFENVVHEDCYCTGYCNDDHTGKDFSSHEVRKKYAVQSINQGKIQGYLAYGDNQVVGWCNANDKAECLKCEGWQRMLNGVNSADLELKIKSVFCFTIAPDMRRKGIASYLLEHICKEAREDGYDYVEAYPNKQFIDIYYDHMGPADLYRKHGFIVYEETENKTVMRKHL